MKRFFITFLFVSLFVAANSVLAINDDKKTKEPVKVENHEKATSSAVEAKSCCGMKENCTGKANVTTTCCSEDKSSKAVATCCMNTNAASDTKKSSGKKSD